jgi:hypothetical protein
LGFKTGFFTGLGFKKGFFMGLGFKTGFFTGIVALHFPPTKSKYVAKSQKEQCAKTLGVTN